MEPTWIGPADLDNCAREPIRIPGSIQPHGVLVAVDAADLIVRFASDNLPEWFGSEADAAIGRNLSDLVGSAVADIVATRLSDTWRERDEVDLVDHGLTLTIHRVDDLAIIEAERLDDAEVPSSHLRDVAMALSAADSVADAAQATADAVRALAGFDRVMVYRFDREWNGEVIAEAKLAELNPFLGLHYPATDIPAQARELYRSNWIRVIADVAYQPAPIVPAAGPESGQPLDLSGSVLRAISPIHIEYLQNMGVTASMSLSLIVDGELWGLVACHHYAGPLRPARGHRNLCEHLAQLASLRIGELLLRGNTQLATDRLRIAHQLAEAISSSPHWAVDEALRLQEANLLKLAGAAGALVIDGPRRHRFGTAPSDELVDEVLAAWADRAVPFETDRAVGPVGAGEPAASGVLAVSFTDDDGAVIWTRAEYVHDVDWGGDPQNAKLARLEGDDVRLSPRKSFELWRQTVQGRALEWHPGEVEAAATFAHLLGGAYLRRERASAAFAVDLQRAMLPATLPEHPEVEFDAHTVPDGRGIVGGDWYDAFAVGDGRIAVVVGDVAGHGTAVAATMAQLRNALRAYLTDDPSPARALDRVDAMCRILLRREMATALVGLLDTNDWTLTLSSAGHPDGFVHRDGAVATLPSGRNTVLGFQSRPNTEVATVVAPGDLVVLFTDGLIESRHHRYDDRLDRLATTLQEVAGGTGLPRALIDQMTADERNDDVTVLSFRRGRR